MHTGHKILTSLTLLALFAVLALAIYPTIGMDHQIPRIAYIFMVSWLLLAIVFCLISYKEFVTGFLISLFSALVSWRIVAIYNDNGTIIIPFVVAFISYLGNFIYCARMNLKFPEHYLHKISLASWQLIFIRLYIGLDFIPHFTEKLFAGPLPHMNDVHAFMSLGVPNPDMFVWLAGLCELGAAVAFALGFFMRIGACGAVLYLLIATYLGNHFSLGFIWAGPGGGWEFATMWAALIFSFAFTGSHEFSLDQRLEETFKLPAFIKKVL